MRQVRRCVAAGLAVLGASALQACRDGTSPEGSQNTADSLAALPRSLSNAEWQGVHGGNSFALALLRQVSANRPAGSGNVLLAPLSVSQALGLTMNGAAGETLAQMQAVLGWGARPRQEINAAYRDLAALLPTLDPGVTVTVANGVWTRQGLAVDSGFVRDAQEYFRAPVQSAATPRAMFDAVNAWGNRETRGMIPRVLTQEPRDDLLMLLANAVYFNGSWRDRFDPRDTRADAPFTLASGAQVAVPLMTRVGGFNAATFSMGNDLPGLAAELPYGNGAYSMLLLRPQSGSVDALVQRLDTVMLGQIVRSLRPETRGIVGVPRFTLSASRELSADLGVLGMPRAFAGDAEFPRLVVNERSKLDFVQHSVAIEVNERGTRAAGVTVVGVVPVSMPASYTFDRPFVFAIRERFTNAILFIGVVRDPRG